jgi:hypothetical protein
MPAALPETAIHSHWCPRCDTTWDCKHVFDRCPLGGSVMIADHCDRPAPWDDDD